MDERGVTLIEILVAVLVSTIVIVAIGSFYVAMQASYNEGNVQSVMQRQGTQVQEQMAKVVAASSALLPGTCGPTSVAGDSLPVQVPADALRGPVTGALDSGGFVCFYLQANQIAQCRFLAANNRACIANSTLNLLSNAPIPQGIQGRRQTTPPTDPSGTSVNVFTIVGGSAVDIRFRLVVEVLGPTEVVGPFDFTTRAAVRNG